MEGSIIFYTYGSTLELNGQQFTAGSADRRSAESVAGRISTHEQTHEAGHRPCGRI